MKFLKYFERWSNDRPKYLGPVETEDINNVKRFIEEHNLSTVILDIWKHAKDNFNVYPSINSHNKLEYISNDANRLIIEITNDSPKIKKIGLSKEDKWKESELYNGHFSYATFNALMQHNGHERLKKRIEITPHHDMAA